VRLRFLLNVAIHPIVCRVYTPYALFTDHTFVRCNVGKADAHLTTNAVAENQTKVAWGFSSSMKYPMNIMPLVMNMEKMLGKDLEASLTDLKGTLEQA
jgi:hypothetical protein